MAKVGLFLFSNDLRLTDNPGLAAASEEVDFLICLYCIERGPEIALSRYPAQLSKHRERFLKESLWSLHKSLTSYNQHLIIREQSMLEVVASLITTSDISNIYRSRNTGWYENNQWEILQTRYPMPVSYTHLTLPTT